MSTTLIFYSGAGVFTLMLIGIVLTAIEFRKMDKLARDQSEKAEKRNN
jgi:hypothetical protein